MRKIIDKKVYDTNTATEIATYSNGLGGNDWFYEKEILYQTRKEKYFLAVDGGAMSKYSENNGRERWGISKIIALTEEETFNWLQKHNEVDIIEERFSDLVEEA